MLVLIPPQSTGIASGTLNSLRCGLTPAESLSISWKRVFQLAVEGNLEPVHYMGVVVDYVRKFDSKLQIELLRAKRPETFKTPGMNVNLATKGDIFVLTEEQRHILMDYNRQWLLDHPPDENGKVPEPPPHPLERQPAEEQPAKEPRSRPDMGATATEIYDAKP